MLIVNLFRISKRDISLCVIFLTYCWRSFRTSWGWITPVVVLPYIKNDLLSLIKSYIYNFFPGCVWPWQDMWAWFLLWPAFWSVCAPTGGGPVLSERRPVRPWPQLYVWEVPSQRSQRSGRYEYRKEKISSHFTSWNTLEIQHKKTKNLIVHFLQVPGVKWTGIVVRPCAALDTTVSRCVRDVWCVGRAALCPMAAWRSASTRYVRVTRGCCVGTTVHITEESEYWQGTNPYMNIPDIMLTWGSVSSRRAFIYHPEQMSWTCQVPKPWFVLSPELIYCYVNIVDTEM